MGGGRSSYSLQNGKQAFQVFVGLKADFRQQDVYFFRYVNAGQQRVAAYVARVVDVFGGGR